MYIDLYLDAAEAHRWTPATYLTYTLRGKAAKYAGRYQHALMNAIQRRMNAGTVAGIRSAGGSIAYIRLTYSTEALPQESI